MGRLGIPITLWLAIPLLVLGVSSGIWPHLFFLACGGERWARVTLIALVIASAVVGGTTVGLIVTHR